MNAILKIACLLLVLGSLAACGEDKGAGPDFAGPDVSGTWTGFWRDASVTMTLDQSGSKVDGTLTRGRETFDISGTVSETGRFEWSGRISSSSACVGMGSTLDDFQVMNQSNEMDGVAVRSESAPSGDNPCGGRAFVQQGAMTLRRAI